MLFKRIEMVGFKSFATKTTVEFLPGVTVIVGPNGCGKSNVLDSIKWVLGSQSAKSLRGGKMQDVIFAGSASFKPLGMAQVTLTIDNSTRLLDIDYDEVQIARRLYRNGDSEYLLNKNVCRLRDIHNLFLGTGVGMSAYSILEQGRIDQIVNAKADERRFLFEEAAGISKFKLRKVEALRKLERTGDDLARLRDLISEVDRQVTALKRQASKAESFRKDSERLRGLEMELMVARSSGLRESIATLDGDIEKIQEKLSALQVQYEEQAKAEHRGKSISQETDAKLSSRTQELFDATNRIKDMQHVASRNEDRARNNERRVEAIDDELAGIEERAGELAGRRDETSRERDAATEEDALARRDLSDLERDHADLKTQVDEIAVAIDRLSRESTKTRELLSHCENVIRVEQTLVARHEETRRETEAAVARISEVHAEQGARREELEARSGALAARIEETSAASATMQIRYTETQSRVSELSSQIESARRELHQKQARLSTLKELKANFEGFFQGVREVMKAAQAGKIKGVVGPVVGLLKSRGEHELALEAALGPHLQDVVVESADGARQGMDFLREGGLGRVTFLPLDWLNAPTDPPELAEALARPGVVGDARTLVNCDPALRVVVDTLLADTVVVNDFETAERLSGDFPRFAYVALSGQVIQATGAMTGGKLKTSGLLGREREIAELTESVDRLGALQEELEARIEAQKEEAARLAENLDETRAVLNELKIEKAGADKELDAARRAFDEAARRLEQSEAQLDKLVREIEGKRTLMAQMEKERVEHERKLAESTAQLEEARERVKEQNELFHAMGARLSEARARAAQVRERLVHLERALEGIEREASQLAAACETRVAERDRLLADSAAAREETADHAEELAALVERRALLETQMNEEKSQKELVLAQLKQLGFELEKTQRDVRVLENELQEKRVRHAELQGTFANLSEQAMEKFERGLEEIAEEIGETKRKPADLQAEVSQIRQKLERMGAVNLQALEEYDEQAKRLEHLTSQEKDLSQAKGEIETSISELDEKTKTLFHETFESVRKNFVEMFRRMFNGGKADLIVDQSTADPLLDGGIEIVAQPPGKKLQSLSLMSGGEKAMTAVSLLFALFLHKPSPFCILDEIDAPLDDANVERFKTVVQEFSQTVQFVIITHNKLTMELADAIYGVTMEESGVSKLVSVRFEHAAAMVEQA